MFWNLPHSPSSHHLPVSAALAALCVWGGGLIFYGRKASNSGPFLESWEEERIGYLRKGIRKWQKAPHGVEAGWVGTGWDPRKIQSLYTLNVCRCKEEGAVRCIHTTLSPQGPQPRLLNPRNHFCFETVNPNVLLSWAQFLSFISLSLHFYLFFSLK